MTEPAGHHPSFDHAVQRELAAIDVHEQAAQFHESRAEQLEGEAARVERGRAEAARERAAHALSRLRDEGVEPPR